jgi:hypothetical protein
VSLSVNTGGWSFGLFFEEIEESLTITVHLGSGAASLLFHKNLGFEQRTKIVGAFIDHTNFNRFNAFISRGGIKVQAIPAGMKIRAAMTAFVRDLYLINYLYLRSAVVASRHQMKFGLNSSSRSLFSRRRFRFSFPV